MIGDKARSASANKVIGRKFFEEFDRRYFDGFCVSLAMGSSLGLLLAAAAFTAQLETVVRVVYALGIADR